VSPQKFTVSQLARLAGVGPDSIRHYERIGIVPKAKRSPAGYRIWNAREVQYLMWVAPAKRAGFALRELADIFRMYRAGSPHVAPSKPCFNGNSLVLIGRLTTYRRSGGS